MNPAICKITSLKDSNKRRWFEIHFSCKNVIMRLSHELSKQNNLLYKILSTVTTFKLKKKNSVFLDFKMRTLNIVLMLFVLFYLYILENNGQTTLL